jgi:hypothetical protein
VEHIPTLEVALRVLTAISLQRTDPDPPDVQELRKLRPTLDQSIEDLACAVVEEEVRKCRANE